MEQVDAKSLAAILRAGHPLIRLVGPEEHESLELLRAAADQCAMWIETWSVLQGIHRSAAEAHEPVANTENPAAALVWFASLDVEPRVFALMDLMDHLSDARVARGLRELVERVHSRGGAVVLVDHRGEPSSRVPMAGPLVSPLIPSEAALEHVVRKCLRDVNAKRKIEIDVSKRDFASIVRNLRGLTCRQATQIIRDVVSDDRRLDHDDVARVIGAKRRAVAGDGMLEFVDAPESLDDVGGIANLKRWLLVRRHATSDEAKAMKVPAPRGALLLGVQGSGKSLCAKAVGAAWGRAVLRLDAGALYDRFVGESERRLREALRQAEATAPVVLWIDEIEKAFASAASQSTDGGLSKRMFGTLLTWMQDHRSDVFLVATANDIEALPPELMRKGRFDEIFFVDLPGEAARRDILSIHLKKRDIETKPFDLDDLARRSAGFSGAELEQAVVSMLYGVLEAKLTGGSGVVADSSRLAMAIDASPPLSVTMRERIDDLRTWAEGRCVKAE